jgi:hypothetical protein
VFEVIEQAPERLREVPGIGQLALLLPRLQNWRQCNPDPFRGSLVRG